LSSTSWWSSAASLLRADALVDTRQASSRAEAFTPVRFRLYRR
jgi:hypothetical protein